MLFCKSSIAQPDHISSCLHQEKLLCHLNYLHVSFQQINTDLWLQYQEGNYFYLSFHYFVRPMLLKFTYGGNSDGFFSFISGPSVVTRQIYHDTKQAAEGHKCPSLSIHTDFP